MLKERILTISIFCLAVSIIISANIIANGMKTNGDYVSTGLSNMSQGLNSIARTTYNINDQTSVAMKRHTYNLNTAAGYLGITEGQLKSITDNKDSNIPHVKIGTEYIFSKSALDKWLETVRIESVLKTCYTILLC